LHRLPRGGRCFNASIFSFCLDGHEPEADLIRPLPQPLHILDGDKPILTLATVADVRELIVNRLPEEGRQKSTWRYVAGLALDAANGGDGADLTIALRMVLSLEGVECRPK
jgi:hypothetical protein